MVRSLFVCFWFLNFTTLWSIVHIIILWLIVWHQSLYLNQWMKRVGNNDNWMIKASNCNLFDVFLWLVFFSFDFWSVIVLGFFGFCFLGYFALFFSCWNPLVSVKTVELTINVLFYTLACSVARCILGDLLFPWEMVSDRSCLRDLAFWFSVFELRFFFLFGLGMNFSAVLRAAWLTTTFAIYCH